jgi:CheY-like chemotaxis protein
MGGLTLLLVEDDVDIVDAASEILRDLGHRVHAAGDAATALVALAEWNPDAVLLDLNVPGGGSDFIRTLRAAAVSKGRPVRIIIITGSSLPEIRARCLEAGADHFLTKPFELSSLVAIL